MGSKAVMYLKVAATMQERLKEAPEYSRRRCIYRVPNKLRQTNEKAYTPMIVSIGPLHHKDKRLVPMEPHKLKYLQFFLQDAQVNEAADLLSKCLGIVKDRETEIRECYGDPIDLCSDDFTKMVLIDSAFIIQLFRAHKYKITKRDNGGDYIFNEPFLGSTTRRDIHLVENQLPLFILDQLYRTAFQTSATNSDPIPSFEQIASKYLLFDLDTNSNVYPQTGCDLDKSHLLHLLRFLTWPVRATENNASKNVDYKSSNSMVIPTATQLHEAGVKFQAIKINHPIRIWSSIDIEFDKKEHILKIPQFSMDDNTEYISRNMIAFEQLNLTSTRYITDFHIFLNRLITSPEDVELLVEAGIIETLMGSPEEVSNLIRSLHSHADLSPQGNYFEQISLDLINHCKKIWPRFRAMLMHKYFKHPWSFIPVIYALVEFCIRAQVLERIKSNPQLSSLWEHIIRYVLTYFKDPWADIYLVWAIVFFGLLIAKFVVDIKSIL